MSSFMKDIGKRPDNLLEPNWLFPPHDWKKPLIVAIDEMQYIAVDRGRPAAKFLQALHNSQRGLPILPVFAGLGDVRNVLSRAGLTRTENIHEIGCLTSGERISYLKKFEENFGLVIGNKENHETVHRNLAKLLDDTEGWPRHMRHSYQRTGKRGQDD